MAAALRRELPSPSRLQEWYDYISGVVARTRVARLHFDEFGRRPAAIRTRSRRYRGFTPILQVRLARGSATRARRDRPALSPPTSARCSTGAAQPQRASSAPRRPRSQATSISKRKSRLWSTPRPIRRYPAATPPRMTRTTRARRIMRVESYSHPGLHVARTSSLTTRKRVDVCLIVEGAYPYVSGGVSVLGHGLIRRQPRHPAFCVVAILPEPPRAGIEVSGPLPNLDRARIISTSPAPIAAAAGGGRMPSIKPSSTTRSGRSCTSAGSRIWPGSSSCSLRW